MNLIHIYTPSDNNLIYLHHPHDASYGM